MLVVSLCFAFPFFKLLYRALFGSCIWAELTKRSLQNMNDSIYLLVDLMTLWSIYMHRFEELLTFMVAAVNGYREKLVIYQNQNGNELHLDI